MTHSQKERLLAYAAQRVKAYPDYLGWVLARYVEQEHITEDNLAQRLGVESRELPRLALCLRPRAEQFADDIRQISGKFNIDPATLAAVVSLVESVEVLAARDAREGSSESGLLMAARARKQPHLHQGDEGRDDDHPKS